ncbi:MAG TPA: TGS domain-containing protein, partial [Amaricoccus sp.]|nr:TGS domain-containing protein [Amaricoccus sp.]
MGEVVKLPRGATPIDFAYAIHTRIGDSCVG